MNRRGSSILEMLIVVTILTALLAVAATLLASLLTHTGRQRSAYQGVQVATRLGESLRRDVRASASVEISDDATQLRLALPEMTVVEYQVVEQGVERWERQEDRVRQTELFRLADLDAMRFERSAGGTGPVICRWTRRWHGPRPVEEEVAALRGHRIVATPGREVSGE